MRRNLKGKGPTSAGNWAPRKESSLERHTSGIDLVIVKASLASAILTGSRKWGTAMVRSIGGKSKARKKWACSSKRRRNRRGRWCKWRSWCLRKGCMSTWGRFRGRFAILGLGLAWRCCQSRWKSRWRRKSSGCRCCRCKRACCWKIGHYVRINR